MCPKSFKLCPTLCTLWTIACTAPLSMGTLQARILEWVAIASSRGSSRPRDQTCVSYVSCIFRLVIISTTWEHGLSQIYPYMFIFLRFYFNILVFSSWKWLRNRLINSLKAIYKSGWHPTKVPGMGRKKESRDLENINIRTDLWWVTLATQGRCKL